jgi:AcrR family transcriptional regulator
MNQSSVSAEAPVTERGRRTRAALLLAAEQVFGKNGFERASISDITRLAGTAQGTFYLYFRDKKSIFIELVEELGHALRNHLREAVAGQKHRIDIEREGFRAFFAFVKQHQNLYRVVRQAEFVDEAVYKNYYRKMTAAYVKGLRAAMAAGQIRKADPERLAYALMGIADFYGMRWILWDKHTDIDGLVEDAMQMVQRGVS